MPKSIITNMDVKKGVSKFQIYYDKVNDNLVLKPEKENNTSKGDPK